MLPGRPLYLCSLAATLLLGACGSSSANNSFTLPGVDVSGGDAAIVDTAGSADATKADAPKADTAATDADSAAEQDAAADSGPANTPPKFDAIAVLALDQGASANLDVAPLLHDAEDAATALKLSWSAKHVALKDPGNHKLYVVAPTAWTGTETIDLTVTDSAGATAVSVLTVVVKPVTVVPVTPQDCGKHTFSYTVAGNHSVFLAGTFNAWSKTADAMASPGGTGTYAVTKTLAGGVYQYKFVVDGAWKTDTGNPNQVPDGYGGTNAVIEVKPCAP